jgi:hypothetical protein
MCRVTDVPRQEPAVVKVQPSTFYTPVLRAGAIRAFGDDGAWLALSILHYGWRAWYDQAVVIPVTRTWHDGDPLGGRDDEYQIVRDLQVQGLMYAAAEQLATLVDAAYAHTEGRSFFQTYVENVFVGKRIDRISKLTRDDLCRVLGVPTDHNLLISQIRAMVATPSDDHSIDLAQLPVAILDNGLYVPARAVDDGVVEELGNNVIRMVEGIHRNIGELRPLVDRPSVSGDFGIEAQSLRETDNSFRHGLRLLFRAAVPNERPFWALHVAEESEGFDVEMYMPRENEAVNFATLSCSPDRTEVHIETIRMICLRMGQVIRGLLVQALSADPALLIAATALQLDGRRDGS